MSGSMIFVFFVASLTFVTMDTEKLASLQSYESNNCLLPPYPDHGSYTVRNYPSAMPGELYSSVKLDILCDIGYKHENNINSILCINSFWSAIMPTCVRDLIGFCELAEDIRVEYRCASEPGSLKTQECESFVPSGTVVKPICRAPGYFSLKVLPEMHCRDGIWDNKPICKPACGMITQHRQLEGSSSKYVELPWYAVIYGTFLESYMERCAGSLITANKIISAAHCLCDSNDDPLPASNFVVAVNKLYYDYNDRRDINSQQSNVIETIIPPIYLGNTGNYENDIAIVVVETPFFFHLSVRPVCLDFDDNLDRTQLTEGNSGKVARWSLQVLNVVDITYLNFEECFNHTPTDYQRFLNNDNFCAESDRGSSLYQADTGVGLTFLESTTQRYYLRGVLTGGRVVINNDTIGYTFTSILKHKHFIKKHM